MSWKIAVGLLEHWWHYKSLKAIWFQNGFASNRETEGFPNGNFDGEHRIRFRGRNFETLVSQIWAQPCQNADEPDEPLAEFQASGPWDYLMKQFNGTAVNFQTLGIPHKPLDLVLQNAEMWVSRLVFLFCFKVLWGDEMFRTLPPLFLLGVSTISMVSPLMR